MVKLIALLGNKGTAYEKTRHNSGWLLGDALLPHLETPPSWQEKFHGLWTKTQIEEIPLIMLKPLTYMNESGKSIGEAIRYFTIDPEETLVVHDDIETPFGMVKLQQGGGLGGHNGLRSAVQYLGSDRFFRLRIGIGRPQHADVASFVLGRFTSDEVAKLPLVMDIAVRLLESFFSQRCRQNVLPMQEKIQ